MLNKSVGKFVSRDSIKLSNHAPSSNVAAVVTLAATASKKQVLHSVQWSYDAAPTGGTLTIAQGGTTVFIVSITAAGPGGFDITIPGNTNEAVTATLAAGGGGISGKINVQYTTERASGVTSSTLNFP